jgi:hypothetical protein
MGGKHTFRFDYKEHDIIVQYITSNQGASYNVWVDGEYQRMKHVPISPDENIFNRTYEHTFNIGEDGVASFHVRNAREYSMMDDFAQLGGIATSMFKSMAMGHTFAPNTLWPERIASLVVDGNIHVDQSPANQHCRSFESLKRIEENYDYIGNMTDEELIALKSLHQGCVCQIANENSILLRASGEHEIGGSYNNRRGPSAFVFASDLRAGDSISVLPSNPLARPIPIDKIYSVCWDEQTNNITIDARNKTFTSVDFKDERRQIDRLIESGAISKDILMSAITPNTTLDEFQVIRTLHERGIEVTDPILELLADGADVEMVMKAVELQMEGHQDIENIEFDEQSQDTNESYDITHVD